MASGELEQMAVKRAGERARASRWDLNVALCLFAVLIIVVMLLFKGIAVGVVAPVAILGLAIIWFMGWRRGRQLYQSFYRDELASLERKQENKQKSVETTLKVAIEETIEKRAQRALLEGGGWAERMSDKAGVPRLWLS